MALQTISADRAKQLADQGAALVDIRERDEYGRERIAGAHQFALSKLDEADLAVGRSQPVIFYCRSGARTRANAGRLADKTGTDCEVYCLEGGLDAWKCAGLPVVGDPRYPIDLQRQVQICAGGIAFSGTLLGLLLSPWFLAVPLFIGAGLMFAGISGFCGMARILMYMPWNRALSAPPTSRA
jgi:rhodanese-related sulfurtransferase